MPRLIARAVKMFLLVLGFVGIVLLLALDHTLAGIIVLTTAIVLRVALTVAAWTYLRFVKPS
jgi:hypothetical protein